MLKETLINTVAKRCSRQEVSWHGLITASSGKTQIVRSVLEKNEKLTETRLGPDWGLRGKIKRIFKVVRAGQGQLLGEWIGLREIIRWNEANRDLDEQKSQRAWPLKERKFKSAVRGNCEIWKIEIFVGIKIINYFI